MGDVYQLRPETDRVLSDKDIAVNDRLSHMESSLIAASQAQQVIEALAQTNGGIQDASYTEAA